MNKKLLSFILSFAFVLGVQPDFTKVNAETSAELMYNGVIAVKVLTFDETGIYSRSIIDHTETTNTEEDDNLWTAFEQSRTASNYMKYINKFMQLKSQSSGFNIDYNPDTPYKIMLKESSQQKKNSLIFRVEYFNHEDLENVMTLDPADDVFAMPQNARQAIGDSVTKAVASIHTKNYIPDFMFTVKDMENHGLVLEVDGNVEYKALVINETIEKDMPVKLSFTSKNEKENSLSAMFSAIIFSANKNNGAEFNIGKNLNFVTKDMNKSKFDQTAFDFLFQNTGAFFMGCIDKDVISVLKNLAVFTQIDAQGSEVEKNTEDQLGRNGLATRWKEIKELIKSDVDLSFNLESGAKFDLSESLGFIGTTGDFCLNLNDGAEFKSNPSKEFTLKDFTSLLLENTNALTTNEPDGMLSTMFRDALMTFFTGNPTSSLQPRSKLQTIEQDSSVLDKILEFIDGLGGLIDIGLIMGGLKSTNLILADDASFQAKLPRDIEGDQSLKVKFNFDKIDAIDVKSDLLKDFDKLLNGSEINVVTPLLTLTPLQIYNQNGQTLKYTGATPIENKDIFKGYIDDKSYNFSEFLDQLSKNTKFGSIVGLFANKNKEETTDPTGDDGKTEGLADPDGISYIDIPEPFFMNEFACPAEAVLLNESGLTEVGQDIINVAAEVVSDVLGDVNVYPEKEVSFENTTLVASEDGKTGSETVKFPKTGDQRTSDITLSITSMMLLALGSLYLSLKKSEEF